MKYIKRAANIDAVQFHYTDESIKEVTDFLGTGARLWYGCDRHPGAVGWGSLLSNGEDGGVSVRFVDGDYIARIDGNLAVIPKSQFESQFEPKTINE